MGPRTADIKRKTKETVITVKLNLDGQGQVEVNTGVGFLDHMIASAMVHGFFDLTLTAQGDTWVDDHHTVEDTGIVLGQAFNRALGDFAGIRRFGEASVPMDEALARAVVDFSRRPFLVFSVPMRSEKIGSFDSQLIEEFWRAFVNNSGANLYLEVTQGQNMHHIFEAVFKAAGRALDYASQIEPRTSKIISTKGVL